MRESLVLAVWVDAKAGNGGRVLVQTNVGCIPWVNPGRVGFVVVSGQWW